MSILTAYLHGIATNLLGAWLGHWIVPQPLHCHCAGPPIDSGLIEVLQSQLNRCGPSDLAPVCPLCPPTSIGFGVGAVLAAGLFGILVGALAGALVVGGLLLKRRPTTSGVAVRDTDIVPTPGPIVSPVSVSSGAVLLRPGKGKTGVIVQG